MAKPSLEPVEVRAQLVDALRLDLVGPGPDGPLASELLSQAPSRWYLTGFLVPVSAAAEQRATETAPDEPDVSGAGGGADDAATPEPPAAQRRYFPSSVGLSLLVPAETPSLQVTVSWGDYHPPSHESAPPVTAGAPAPIPVEEIAGGPTRRARRTWQRRPRQERVSMRLPAGPLEPTELAVPESGGLTIVGSARSFTEGTPAATLVPAGTRSVSLFLVNRRTPAEDETRDQAFAFQVQLEVSSPVALVPRPNLRGRDAEDPDERVADLHYRDACEFAVGHGIAAEATVGAPGACHTVRTDWLPTAAVEYVAPATIPAAQLSMEHLASLTDMAQAVAALQPLVDEYRVWIQRQRDAVARLPTRRREVGEDLVDRAVIAADRIQAGIELLADDQVRQAFCLANRAMAVAARQRRSVQLGLPATAGEPPQWRPFQLAFLLMNLRGMADPTDYDRETVDLLFFPTGGGKTEAYLGLAAFALVLRRLRHPGVGSAGLSVLMRYTLRLLTLDQLSRAATLVCALELERQRDPGLLGPWPFEIGLWVGLAATPNRMGAIKDQDRHSARAKTIAYKNDDRKPAPIPLEECPWCGTKFTRNSFCLVPDASYPADLRVQCANRTCAFTRDRPLPILSVDEPIYRRLPCFMIATIDKFAAMPWTGRAGALLGSVDRWDKAGFFGPCDPGKGQALGAPLPPVDLIIQDELHLISGPVGTMMGLYEAAVDGLCTRDLGGHRYRPKIVASTATVRRAEKQIRALFARRDAGVFPPPGPDLRDSFFARTRSPQEQHARLYLGVAAPGRSPKVVLLRVYLALLGAAAKAYAAAGGRRRTDNPADAYMTLLGYFGNLRELGGSRRIVEDEVSTRISGYGSRRREGDDEGLFADRRISYEVLELTSRVSTNRVAEAKRRLALPFAEKSSVDVALATNMISVGLDIIRLGLMVVSGQPKSSAEYIQATSRVGRDPRRPGLVVTLFNAHRPRDRSHYERFAAYHQSFYRSVEATSVTPFSPRALDRGLAAVLVAMSRHGQQGMAEPLGAGAILDQRAALGAVVESLMARAAAHDSGTPDPALLEQRVRERAVDLLDEWARIAQDYADKGIALQYQRGEVGSAMPLLRDFLDPELDNLAPRHRKFRASRSLRDVESQVNLMVRTLDNIELEGEEA